MKIKNKGIRKDGIGTIKIKTTTRPRPIEDQGIKSL